MPDCPTRRTYSSALNGSGARNIRSINPYSYIGGNPNLTVRLIHGIDNDDTVFDVPPEVSTQFHETLTDAGYDADLTIIEGGTHGDITVPHSETFKVTVQQVMQVANDWLSK